MISNESAVGSLTIGSCYRAVKGRTWGNIANGIYRSY